MAKYVLPDISGVWDKERYPYALIEFVINKETSPTSKYACLHVVDLHGYIERAERGNNYCPHSHMLYLIHYATYRIALNDAAVEYLNKYWSGVNKETWCLCCEDHAYGLGMGDGPHWANTTLYDADGNLFLEASDPGAPIILEEPIDPLKSFLIGYALGLSGKPLPLSGGEPVAYLYNGVRLPKLPEWDKEKYPNAMITDGIHTTVTGIGVATVLNLGTFHYEWNQYGRYQFNMKDCALYKLIDNKWVLSYEGDRNLILNPDEERTTDYVLWTDTDIVSSTGSVWLAASEPIPVYE